MSPKLTNAKKILVTGADGFIGSHLIEALVRTGHNTLRREDPECIRDRKVSAV